MPPSERSLRGPLALVGGGFVIGAFTASVTSPLWTLVAGVATVAIVWAIARADEEEPTHG